MSLSDLLSDAFRIGARNALPLLFGVVLWALTLWIPYVNVGATIGVVGLVARMGRGEIVSPFEIFHARYRKQMGEFFLVVALIAVGVTSGLVFGVLPGIVISFAWSLAPLMVVDLEINPTEALQQSNDATWGHKVRLFIGTLMIGCIVAGVHLIFGLFSSLLSAGREPPVLAVLLIGLLWSGAALVGMTVQLSVYAAAYRHLVLAPRGLTA